MASPMDNPLRLIPDQFQLLVFTFTLAGALSAGLPAPV
jgi:hypothetical protein